MNKIIRQAYRKGGARQDAELRAASALFTLVSLLFLIPSARAAGPNWWIERGVLSTGSVVSTDYAPLNLGQLKWMATNAYDELQLRLLPFGSGAGSEIQNLVNNFSLSNNYVTVNVGQLKRVAKPFYDRLIEKGCTNSCPWTTNVADDADYAIANIGQLKHLFGFDLSNLDSDSDNLPDPWENQWFGTTNWSSTDDFDGDALNNAGEYLHGTCPTNSDTDGDGYNDGIEVSAGSDPLNASSCPSADISGAISYSGIHVGPIMVVAVTESDSWVAGYAVSLTVPGSYSITNIQTGTNYWLKAWRDSNTNSERDYWEAQGVFTSNPVWLTNDVSGINMALGDSASDLDADGLPDNWEMHYFGSTNYSALGDNDADGLNNSNEFAFGASPTNSDTDGDTLSDGAEVTNRTDPNNSDTTVPSISMQVPAYNSKWIIVP